MKRDRFFAAAVLAALAVLFGAVFVLGQQQDSEAGGQERAAVATIVSPLLQYQARLSDPATGDPVSDGIYTIAFRLYAAPSGGQPLWSEVKDVPVQNGLLSVLLGDTTALDQGLFNGGALWLGIKVGADAEAVPRQQLVPVAYALGLVPGAAVTDNSAEPALSLSNSGSGPALAAQGAVSVDGDLNVSGSLIGGAHNHSNYVDWYSFDTEITNFVDWYSFDDHIYGGMHHERYTDAEAIAAVENSPTILNSYWGALHTADASAHHSRYSNSEAVSAIKAADGSGSGLDADLLDGQQAGAFAPAAHGHTALPIAYGIIREDGSVQFATSNVTSSFDGVNYVIGVSGYNLNGNNNYFIMIDTGVGKQYQITYAYGKIRVTFLENTYVIRSGFHFVLYKY